MNIINKKEDDNYNKYRGKCKEYCEALVKENPELRIVRGHYYEPLWNTEEQHFWCVDSKGVIHDPTKLQFPSGGMAEFYRAFDGIIHCEECGKEMQEKEAIPMGRYAVCSDECAMRLVGL